MRDWRNMLGKLKRLGLLVFLLSMTKWTIAQNADSKMVVEKVWRINFLNPSLELEIPVKKMSAISTSIGVGYGGAYPDLSFNEDNGFNYLIAPFVDVQYKWLYNINKRAEKMKTTIGNSSNFISARVLTRGESFAENFDRTSKVDFAFGPTWGVQRRYGRFHLLFDVGPIYYTDFKGNSNIFPLMIQLNLGLDL